MTLQGFQKYVYVPINIRFVQNIYITQALNVPGIFGMFFDKYFAENYLLLLYCDLIVIMHVGTLKLMRQKIVFNGYLKALIYNRNDSLS